MTRSCPALLIPLEDGIWDADARAELEDVAETIDARLGAVEEDVDTLGGLAFVLAGHVPQAGRDLDHPSGWRLEVTEGDTRRVPGCGTPDRALQCAGAGRQAESRSDCARYPCRARYGPGMAYRTYQARAQRRPRSRRSRSTGPTRSTRSTPRCSTSCARRSRRLPGCGARCLLLTGEGRGFSSGADLAGGGGLPDDVGASLETHFNPLIEAVFACPIPVVAAVNGPCAGAGCSLALAADIVIAGALGLFPPGLRQYRPDPRRRRDLAAAASRRPRPGDGDDDARRAHLRAAGARMGDDQPGRRGRRAGRGRRRAGRTPRCRTDRRLGLIRRLARDAEQNSLAESLAAERVAQREAGRTDDFQGAVIAFLQKQQPTFEGR